MAAKVTGPASEARTRARNEAKILKAATEVFARKGFDGARMSDIAALSGLPRPNVHYYFRTKQDVYRRLIGGVIGDWDKALENIAADREPADALAAYVRAKFEHERRHAAEARLFANEILHGARFLSPATRRHVRDVTSRHASIIETWMAEGRMVRLDARNLLIMIWAMTEFYSFFEPVICDALGRRRLGKADFERAADFLVAFVLRGCIARPDRRR